MGRKSLRTIVEGICRTLQQPISLRELVRQVTQQAGVPERPGTLLTVREVVSALPFMVKAGPDAYLPAWLVLDGKAFRLRPPPGGWRGELARERLELVAEVLESPRLVWEDGRPLCLALTEPADGAGQAGQSRAGRSRVQRAETPDPNPRTLAEMVGSLLGLQGAPGGPGPRPDPRAVVRVLTRRPGRGSGAGREAREGRRAAGPRA